MRPYRLVLAATAVALVRAVNIRSSAQAPATAGAAAPKAAPSAARPAPTAPQAGRSSTTTAAARSAAPRVAPKPAMPAPSAEAFNAVTKALFYDTCGECHNSTQLESNLDLARPLTVASMTTERDMFEKVLVKLKAREMPPPDVARPDEQINAIIPFLEKEFERQDALLTPDPGRVTARRLNRTEYTNTIRDLLSVEFRADRNFPTDDSGDGFDNIGDVLTVSPVLMDKYLSAANRIAERAIGTTTLPKPIDVEYSLRLKNLRRIDPSNVEAVHRVDFDAAGESVC